MATSYIAVEAVSVGFGVSMKSSENPKPKNSEAKKFAKKAKGSFSLAHGFASGSKLFSATAGRRLNKTVIPAIAAFAKLTENHISENHIWIIKLSDDAACLQVLENRSPYSDEVMSIADIATAVTNKYSELQLRSGFVVHMTPDFDAEFSNQFSEIHALSVEELVKNSSIAAFKMQPVTDNTLSIVLGLCAVSLFSYMGYDYWNKAQEQEALSRISTIIPVDVSKEYEVNVKQMLTSAGMKGSDIAVSLEKVFHETHASVAGWSLTLLTCSPTQCSEIWERKNGTHASLREAFIENLTFDKDQTKAIHTQNMQSPVSAITPENLTNYTALEAKLIDLVEPLNEVGKLTLNLEPHKLYGLAANQKAEQIPTAKQIRSGNFEIRGPLGLAMEFIKQLPPNTAVRTVSVEKVQSETDPTFTVKGEYFVK